MDEAARVVSRLPRSWRLRNTGKENLCRHLEFMPRSVPAPPVQAYLRCDEEPIHNPNQIYEPDHLIVLDPTLISPVILSGLKPGGMDSAEL